MSFFRDIQRIDQIKEGSILGVNYQKYTGPEIREPKLIFCWFPKKLTYQITVKNKQTSFWWLKFVWVKHVAVSVCYYYQPLDGIGVLLALEENNKAYQPEYSSKHVLIPLYKWKSTNEIFSVKNPTDPWYRNIYEAFKNLFKND